MLLFCNDISGGATPEPAETGPAQGHPTPGSGIITAYGSDSDDPEDRGDGEEDQPDYLPGAEGGGAEDPPPPVVEQGPHSVEQNLAFNLA